jgi:predicted secreted protein
VKSRAAALAVLLAALVVTGCSLWSSPPGPRPAEIVVAPGDRFTLRLDADRPTGFRWELARPLDPAVLELVGTEYEEAASAAVGASGSEVWTFAAVGSGWATVNLAYRRPWEQLAPARIAIYSVDVAP